MRRALVAVLSVISLVGWAATASPSRAAVPSNVNASRAPLNQAEAAIAVNPLDPNDVVVVSNSAARELLMGVSHDGGQTWSTRTFADGADPAFGTACCDPSLAWDDQGNLFLAWLDYYDAGAIPTAISIDAGDNWAPLEELHPRRPGSTSRATAIRAEREAERPGTSVDQPTIVAGVAMVWLVWNNAGWIQASGARVSGLGSVGRFRRPETAPATKHCTFGDISIGPAGQVAQVCTVGRHHRHRPPTADILTSLDPDGLGPAGFGTPTFVGSTNVAMFDRVRPQRVRTIDPEAGLAWDRTGGVHDGRLYLVFTNEQPQESGNTDIWVSYSDDAGATWSAPLKVNDDGTSRTQMLPRIAIDEQTGTLAVGWHDARFDAGLGGLGDTDGRKNTDVMYYLAFSYDGGSTFGSNVRVSQGASNATGIGGVQFGDYTGLAFVGGVAHPAWADDSNSTDDNPAGALVSFDVYTAAVPA